ncbi:hypothetical protein ACSBR2_023357 [Camellia fascicularis]
MLTSLQLSRNSLIRTIPSSLFALPSLINIDLSDYKLEGPIPGSVYELQNLTDLVLSSNNLSGLAPCNLSEFPNFLREQARLASLDLSNNKIHGEVPKWIFDVGKNTLGILDLSHNFLTSLESLPWQQLEEIPPLICGLRSLGILDLSNNSLSGLIPQCSGNLSNLFMLNLGINGFYGTSIATFTKGNWLRNLNLNGNQIEGQVPRSLLNCRHLEVLNLGKKQDKRYISTLVENSSRIAGTSKTKGKHSFPRLRIIDISCNEFTGLLPTNYIKQFGAMINVDEHEIKLKYMGNDYYQDSMVVVIKGSEIELSRILTVLKYFYILTKSLDHSSNELVGVIPEQLTSLMFLEVLNLSDNQLAGPIPQGSQFNTFGSDSYSGNLALCGFPLSKKCKELQPLPPPPTLQQDENLDKSSGFSWQVVVLWYGCGFVFGMVMGYIMFVTQRPEWLMKIVDRKHHTKIKRSKKGAH